MSEKKLVRPSNDRMISGVCAGLGNYFGIDAIIVRILFVVFTIMFVGSGILIYAILWIVMPEETAGDVDVVAKNITDESE